MLNMIIGFLMAGLFIFGVTFVILYLFTELIKDCVEEIKAGKTI